LLELLDVVGSKLGTIDRNGQLVDSSGKVERDLIVVVDWRALSAPISNVSSMVNTSGIVFSMV
jgi:hypothetical protein